VRPNEAPPFGAIFDWDGVIIDSARLHEQSWHRLAAELGTAIAPTSFIRGFGMKSAQIIEQIHRWASEPDEVARLTNRKEALYREIVRQSEIAPLPGVVEWLARLHAAGVPNLPGMDAPNPGTAPGASLHRELELLVRGGLTPLEALHAATSLPAVAFALQDRGRIALGCAPISCW